MLTGKWCDTVYSIIGITLKFFPKNSYLRVPVVITGSSQDGSQDPPLHPHNSLIVGSWVLECVMYSSAGDKYNTGGSWSQY